MLTFWFLEFTLWPHQRFMTLKSISTKVFLFVSYSLIPLGGVALWAGIFWCYWAGGFLGLHLILCFLAAALPLIGWQNENRIKKQSLAAEFTTKKIYSDWFEYFASSEDAYRTTPNANRKEPLFLFWFSNLFFKLVNLFRPFLKFI